MEWPPRSGRQQTIPEIDHAAWFGLDEARVKILKGQAGANRVTGTPKYRVTTVRLERVAVERSPTRSEKSALPEGIASA